ncbi:hypothetical protein [Sedimentisphaera salicampi]|uniref:hypothetical protein n=1 Tax=Sedimentisphaera salicampi TaxID=1941349 RepID=UPI000B9A3FA9|nr:hypothetical protein [Sedimentisphaera salicampi]
MYKREQNVSSGGQMIEYKYDALGRRVAASSGGLETYRLYDALGRCVKELTTADSGVTLAGGEQ